MTTKAIELTQQLLRFNTINPPGNEAPCAQFLGAMLETAGFRVSYHAFADQRTSVVASIGTGDKPMLGFTGHIDTVPLGSAPWSKDAFAGELDGDRLYGRGSSDMKSGIAAFITAALPHVKDLKRTSGLTPEILVDALFDYLCHERTLPQATVRGALLADYVGSGARASPQALLGHLPRQAAPAAATGIRHTERQHRHAVPAAP